MYLYMCVQSGCRMPCVNSFGSLQPMAFGSAKLAFLDCGVKRWYYCEVYIRLFRPNAREFVFTRLATSVLSSPNTSIDSRPPLGLSICQTLQPQINLLQLLAEPARKPTSGPCSEILRSNPASRIDIAMIANPCGAVAGHLFNLTDMMLEILMNSQCRYSD